MPPQDDGSDARWEHRDGQTCHGPYERMLIATVFNYSLDGLLADERTEFWKFCLDLPENREPDDPAQLDFL